MKKRPLVLAWMLVAATVTVSATSIVISPSEPLPPELSLTTAWRPVSSDALPGSAGGWMLLGDPLEFFVSSATPYVSASFEYWSVEGWTVRASMNTLTVGSGVNGGLFLPPGYDSYDWMMSGGVPRWKYAEIATPFRSLDFSYPGPQTDTLYLRNLTFTPVAVPEPSALVLLAPGVAWLVRLCRRQKGAASMEP